MTFFIFAGDMLVMLFMISLVIWVFMVSPDSEIEQSAMIPLQDEEYPDDTKADGVSVNEAGTGHG